MRPTNCGVSAAISKKERSFAMRKRPVLRGPVFAIALTGGRCYGCLSGGPCEERATPHGPPTLIESLEFAPWRPFHDWGADRSHGWNGQSYENPANKISEGLPSL